MRHTAHTLWYRVITSRVPRVASSYTLDSEPSSTHHSVLLDSLYRVFRTCGGEPTRRRKQWRDKFLVQAYRSDKNPPKGVHPWIPSSRSAAARSLSILAGAAKATERRAISATWRPAHGPPARLHASRSTRLQRLRCTAPPFFLPATKTTRPGSGSRGSLFGITSTTTVPRPARIPSLNNRSMSVLDLIVSMAGTDGLRPPGIRQRLGRVLCGPCDGERLEPLGHHGSTCDCESHASSHASGYLAGMYASLNFLRSGAPGILAPSPVIIVVSCRHCQRNHAKSCFPPRSTTGHLFSICLLKESPQIVDTVENAASALAYPVDNS